jgi:predicted DCC family thiol-disulfide oxidoreductase YuxK
LQSNIGQKVLWENNMNPEDFKSFIFVDRGKVYTKSAAALRVAIMLGKLWWLLGIILLVPPFIRDGVYSWVAKNRYQWFGKKEECWIPTPELQELFVD